MNNKRAGLGKIQKLVQDEARETPSADPPPAVEGRIGVALVSATMFVCVLLLIAFLSKPLVSKPLVTVPPPRPASPLIALNEAINANNSAILKSLVTSARYAKNQATVADAAAALAADAAKLKAFGPGVVARIPSTTIATWNGLANALAADTAKLSTMAAANPPDYAQVKAAFKKVAVNCMNCHMTFR